MEYVISFLSNPKYTVTVLGIFAFLILLMAFFLGAAFMRIKLNHKIKMIRLDSVKRSRSVIGGQTAEQLAPFLPDFPCNPGDVRFVGKPIDYVAFKGAAENDKIEEIVLIEVKTGSSQLSSRERQIKECVEQGKVSYKIYRIAEKKVKN